MKVTYENSLKYQILQLVEQTPHNVLLRQDFTHLGSYRQISRVLNTLIHQKKLVKIGFGIYAKAYESKYSDQPLMVDGFDVISREALNRLDAKWEPSSAEQDYNTGKTQQVPVHNFVRLKTRLRRHLEYADRQLHFEGNINAR